MARERLKSAGATFCRRKIKFFLSKINCILGQIKLFLLKKYLTKPPLTNTYLVSKLKRYKILEKKDKVGN